VTTETILAPDPELAAEVEPDAGLSFLLDAYDHTEKTVKLEYFGENRRLDVGGGATALSVDAQKKLRSSKSPRKFAFVPSFITSLAGDTPRAERFQAILSALSPSASYDAAAGRLASSGRPIIGYDELSASERDAVIFASVASLVTLAHSVVVVDRPDLYIRDEARLAEGLSRLGPSNQIFVATPSADIFRAAPSRASVLLG